MANDIKDNYMKSVKSDIDGNVDYTKAVNPDTHFIKFTQMLRLVMKHIMRVREGLVNPEWKVYKVQLLKLCLEDGTKIVEKVASLKLLPNGDWREFGMVEVRVPVGSNPDVQRIQDVVAEGTSSTICGARFTRWRQERWEGAEKSWSEWLLLEGINGLATLTLVAFNLQRSGAPDGKCLEGADAFITAIREPALYPALPAPVADDAEPPNNAAPPNAEAGGDIPPTMTEEELKRQEAAKALASAVRWTNTRPFGRGVVIRQTLEMFKRPRKIIFYWMSKRFERRERLVEMNAGKPNDQGIPRRRRTYAVVEAANGRLVEEIGKTSRLLLECDGLWKHIIPQRDQTQANLSLAFTLTSGAECALSKSVVAAHKRCSVAVFKALVSDEEAARLDSKRQC